jgi:hypothetical protein
MLRLWGICVAFLPLMVLTGSAGCAPPPPPKPVVWQGTTAYCPYCRSGVALHSTTCAHCSKDFLWSGTSCPRCGGAGTITCRTCEGSAKKWVACANCEGHGGFVRYLRREQTAPPRNEWASLMQRFGFGKKPPVRRAPKPKPSRTSWVLYTGGHSPGWHAQGEGKKIKVSDDFQLIGEPRTLPFWHRVRSKYLACPICNPEGYPIGRVHTNNVNEMDEYRAAHPHLGQVAQDCESCSGTGKIQCDTCSGTGRIGD